MLPRQSRYGFSPITRRPDYEWPGGKRLALYVALGIEEYVFGEGITEDLFPGAPKPDYVNTSWRDYGNRVGGFRLIKRFADFGVPLTILLNTEVYDHAPDLMDFARRHGCEIVGHGLTNSDTLAGRAPADEAAYLKAVADRIEEVEGGRPGGWSSPWLSQTENTADLLKKTGYRYLMDLRLDDQPVWLQTRAGPLLALPYALELNDSSTLIGRQGDATDFERMIVDEFDEMLEASKDQPLVMSVVVHSFISGAPFRLRALTRALEHITRRRDEVWITQPREIAAFMEANPHLAV
ncbi:polysaccharide deacetylase family protein [Aureimonas sp. AU22]|uniref:polysaccharide deacetylase family protein n=1 Tax=Aureimonas sp. AU22 TaxID=1638162 RepID=UPI0007801C3D|nr:polysaccharide deacetylase family protein [Aureimonas sp. AU22]